MDIDILTELAFWKKKVKQKQKTTNNKKQKADPALLHGWSFDDITRS